MPELTRYQYLRKKIVQVMIDLLTKQFHTTSNMVRSLIQVQDAYINTYHPDFMGGANSIVNVFDINNYKTMMTRSNKPPSANASFDEVQGLRKIGQAKKNTNSPYDNLSFESKNNTKANAADQTSERVNNYKDSEIQKYRNKDVEPIRLPDIPEYMRAEDQDPGQSSPRSQLEVQIVKSLIVSYFDTVRKSMNDMVPKTIMAFLVNKTKAMV